MHSPDKRRGGSHVLRTGPTRHGHGTASATTGSSTGGGGSNNNSGNKSDGDALPAPPPKAAMASGGMSPDEAHDGALRRELRQRDDETRRQRLQIRGLKDWVSTSTRSDGQTSDEVFADSLARLANGLQNWVIVHFRRAKLDLSNVDEATLAELGELVPLYRDLANTAKIHMLQAVVSKILVDMVFSAYFVGLSDEQTQHFTQMEKLLSSFAASDEAVNQWRSSTLALVRRDAAQLLQAETGAVVESVVARVNRILDAMTAQHSPGDARDSALRALVNSSIELARLLVVQRAVLRVHVPEVLPHQRVRFEPDTMEDVGGLEDHALTEREIDCVVFPGVIKHGDESGGQMQFRNVIAKARVLCKPGD
ncbi:hypothetical protein HIM_01587 [Hirsutella minnesotensis 3608]|nr:hypothetical protein HIM_01587 [Hirsutella minnesotensis 3608]